MKSDIVDQLRELPPEHFPLAMADVPWNHENWSGKGDGRSPNQHYDVMSLDAIAAIGPHIDRVMKKNSRILFWLTGPFLAIGAHIPILDTWGGFRPTAMWQVWVKPVPSYYQNPYGVTLDDHVFKMGLGKTTRQNAEYVIEARRGNPPPRLSASIRQVIVEPARESGRKPEKSYVDAERYARGPYLEIFGRTRRPGWTVLGNQVGMFR